MNPEENQTQRAPQNTTCHTELPDDDTPMSVAARVLKNLPTVDRELFFGTPTTTVERENGKDICNLLIDWTHIVPCEALYEQAASDENVFAVSAAFTEKLTADELLMCERRARAAFGMYKNLFPTSLWHCCKRQCFMSIAIDPQELPLLKELKSIHDFAEEIHECITNVGKDPATREKGVGGSKPVRVAPGRRQREREEGIVSGTDRQRGLQRLSNFVTKVLPFLYGKEDANGCERSVSEKLCTKAICELLGVSRSFLYFRRKRSSDEGPNEFELSSIVDTAGVRLRQHRRKRDRTGYPSILDLPHFDCGCPEPCFAGLKTSYLQDEYNAFASYADSLNPERKENLYLLNVMYYPLSNSPVEKCDNAISALYTVSKGHVRKVRSVLRQMCNDDATDHRVLLKDGIHRSVDRRHPILKYGPEVREKVERFLDFVLRADPAGADGSTVCRVYSPEINTQDKLRKAILNSFSDEEEVKDHLSESTLQRIVNKYLKDRNCTVSFSQKDHNACPICQAQSYAVLQYSHELKVLERQYSEQLTMMNESEEMNEKLEGLKARINAKRSQEKQTIEDFQDHLSRDASIRKTIKLWSDHFRSVERAYRRKWRSGEEERVFHWNSLADHGMITHQDDMTKVDLPSFLVTASSDITRWRYDVNAHVSSVDDDCVVFSHEQGTGAKNAASICEMILLDHLIRCKGQRIKAVVSDNASVGKNWVTTIALPQYMVDQGLADVVFIIFLENNHGKWLADLLFGQLQTKRRKTTLLGIDDLLAEFENLKRKSGTVRGFAANPLSSIDFTEVFSSLGYQTKPPKDFGFIKRNIHFAAACKQEAKSELPQAILDLFGDGLPCDEGMVRISSSPPTTRAQSELPFEERFFDVPAALLTSTSERSIQLPHVNRSEHDRRSAYQASINSNLIAQPLVVPFGLTFQESRSGFVSQRTAQHVGYNGIGFRKFKGYPQLHDPNARIVRQAWPPGLIKRFKDGEDPQYGVESKKCAPENWVLREPVGHFRAGGNYVARYPPRNMLNAKYGKAPRVEEPWIPTKAYEEPSFPIIENTAAAEAMRILSDRFVDIAKPVSVLDILQEVYRNMGHRHDVVDQWLHQKATMPCQEAIAKYKNELRIFVKRYENEPAAVKTVRQHFKEDPVIIQRAQDLLSQQQSGTTAKGAKTKIFATLFNEASKTPGELDKYVHMVEKDMERYARDIQAFRIQQEAFDREMGLLSTRNESAEGT